MGKIRDRMQQDLQLAGYVPNTRAHYLGAVARFVRRFMRSPEQMGQEELRTHLKELTAGGLGPATVKVHIAALRFLYSKTLGRPQEVAWMSWPRQPRGLPRVLDVSEVVALLAAIRKRIYRCIALVMYGAGLRIGEAIRLQVGDIDAARKILRVRRGKGGKSREVMLSPKLLVALRTYWRAERPALPYLFASPRTGKPVSADTVRAAIKRARAHAGIKKAVTPHMLRHCFATHLLDNGTDVRVIQHLLGHAGVDTTMRYTKVSTAIVAKTTSPLDKLPVPKKARLR
jgi:integrase/recombinase XerD